MSRRMPGDARDERHRECTGLVVPQDGLSPAPLGRWVHWAGAVGMATAQRTGRGVSRHPVRVLFPEPADCLPALGSGVDLVAVNRVVGVRFAGHGMRLPVI